MTTQIYNKKEAPTVGRVDNKLLINADCLEAMKNIPDNSIDLILTDPPYG